MIAKLLLDFVIVLLSRNESMISFYFFFVYRSFGMGQNLELRKEVKLCLQHKLIGFFSRIIVMQVRI